ncbi:MAG: DUF421 domain-containing protein [Acidobacteria bacterium]|nr:DUF421 domain-containing protein [Acidobacteriota bacterium]
MFIEIGTAFFDPAAWPHMFSLDNTATWPEKIIRPIVVYASLVVLLRIFGRRELAQLNPFDLVVILSLSNTVQNAIIGQDNSLIGGLVGAIALLLINYFFAWVKFKFRTVEKLAEGNTVKLMENSRIHHKAVRREMMTDTDLASIVHEAGFDCVEDVEKIVLDPNGKFLVEGKDEIKDNEFKSQVLKKIDSLTKQISDLTATLQKT